MKHIILVALTLCLIAGTAQASRLGNFFTQDATFSVATTVFSNDESSSEGLGYDKAFRLNDDWTLEVWYKTSQSDDLSGFGIHRKLFGGMAGAVQDLPWRVTLGLGPGARQLLLEDRDIGGFTALGLEVADWRAGFQVYWDLDDVTARQYRPTATFKVGVVLDDLPF